MKTRFLAIFVFVEIVSIAFMFFLLRQDSLPEKTGVILVWLMPITFGCHVVEEFVFPGGFSDWNKSYRPRFANAMTPSYLFKVNAIPGVATILVTLGVFNYVGGYSFFGIRAWHAFLSFLAFNSIYHVLGSIRTKQYSPGMVTSIVLYLPLTVISFTYFLRTGVMDIFSAIVCVAIGSVIQLVLDSIKERNLKEESVFK